ncbi:MAG: hypothetical protein K0S70_669 [Microbacterium sp.]|jgi:hypothetical protein|nr:hypothetical protein [Microbacterium sp.]
MRGLAWTIVGWVSGALRCPPAIGCYAQGTGGGLPASTAEQRAESLLF